MTLEKLYESAKSGKFTMSVIGIGRVGLPLSLAFAKAGIKVYGVDRNEEYVRSLENGTVPFKENNIEKYFPSSNFIPTTDTAVAVSKSDVIIITVGTPLTEHTRPDYSQLKAVLAELSKTDLKGKALVMRSTASPGTLDSIIIPALEKNTGLKAGRDFAATVCPERIVAGKALEELWSLPEFIGAHDDISFGITEAVFRKLNPKKVIMKTTPKAAELGKLFCNVYRYINFTLANEFGMLSQFYGEDAHEIIDMLNSDYHRGGLPKPGLTGGPCLSKDGYYLISHLNFPDFILLAWRLNESMPRYIVDKVGRALKEQGKDIWKSKIAVLGMAFKANIDDLRYSPAMGIIDMLKTENAGVYAHDPNVEGSHSLEEATKDADAIILAVNHDDFKNLESKVRNHKKGCILFDCWGMLKPDAAEASGFRYIRFGSGKYV